MPKLYALVIFSLLLMAFPAFCAEEPSRQETEQLDFAQGLLARAMYPMAIAEYQKFITAFPQSNYLQEAHLAIGECYFQDKQYPQATESFNQFKSTFPQSSLTFRATLRLGQIALIDKKYDQALTLLLSIDRTTITNNHHVVEINYYLAKTYLGNNNPEEALKFLQLTTQSLESGPLTPYAYGDMGAIYSATKDYPQAINAYSKAVLASTENDLKGHYMFHLAQNVFLSGDYAKATTEFEEIIDKYPTIPEAKAAITNLLLAQLNLGKYEDVITTSQQRQEKNNIIVARALMALKRYEEAESLLTTIINLPSSTTEEKTNAVLKKADIFIIQKKFTQALEILGPAITQATTMKDEALYLTAQAHFGLGQFDDAANLFNEVVRNYPQSNYIKAALLGRAHSNQQGGKFKEAGEDFLQFASSDSDTNLKAEALFDAAVMASKQQEYPEAINRTKQYLSAFPTGQHHEQAVLMLSDLYARTDNAQQAIDFIDGYVALHPEAKGKDAFNFVLGYNYQRVNNLDKALEYYSKVIGQGEDKKLYVSALKNAAVISLDKKDDVMALAFFDRVVSEETTNTLSLKTLLWMCDKYLTQKKYEQALRLVGIAEKIFAVEGETQLAYFKAEAFRGLNDMPNAVQAYDNVLKAAQRDMYTGSALIGKGIILTSQGQHEEALKLFLQALTENAEDNTVTLRARFESGNTALAANNKDTALNFYLLVATLYDNEEYCPLSLFNAGNILIELQRKDEAVKSFIEIVEKYKDSPLVAEAKKKLEALHETKS